MKLIRGIKSVFGSALLITCPLKVDGDGRRSWRFPGFLLFSVLTFDQKAICLIYDGKVWMPITVKFLIFTDDSLFLKSYQHAAKVDFSYRSSDTNESPVSPFNDIENLPCP